MELKIYDKANNLRLTASPNSSSTVTEEIGGECSVSASFTHTAYVPLDVDDYIELEGVRYKVKSRYRPKQKNTQTYEYSVKFYAPIHDAEDTLMLFQEGGTTSEFSYDGGPREHLQLWIDNMNRRAGGNLWSIGTVITAENKTIDYRNVKCWDAAFGSNGIAATFGTEMWADGYVINLCKAERGEVVELGYLKGLTNLAQEDNGEVKFFTRLFPLGSTRNIDATKYGYSRLQLPDRSLYVDKNVDLYGVKEDTEEDAFSAIYPKYVGTVSSVRTEEKTSEEGREYTVYYFKDNGMNWNPKDYEIPDLDYMLQFQTGELAGRGTDGSFQAAWHEDTGEWEIINVYPDDTTQIPGGAIIPTPGDQYIPWNFAMPQEYITAAEQEYKQAVDDFLNTYSFDPNKYTGTTDRNYIEKNNTPLRIGWNVRLLSEQYFGTTGGYKDTRITKVQRKLNDLCQATITCSDQVGTGWKSSVDNQLNNLKYVLSRQEEQTIIDIIRTTDSKTPSDNNVFSALKALNTFLSKNRPDSTRFLLSLLGGAIFGKDGFASGLTGFGAKIDEGGNAEVESLTSRRFIETPELRYNRVDVKIGDKWRAPGAGIIESVDTDSKICTLKLEDGEIGAVAVDDICMGIFHSQTASENATEDTDDSRGNRTFAGFCTVYFTVTEVIGSRNEQFKYQIRPVSERWKFSFDPFSQMNFVSYGNFTNEDRQTSVYETRTYTRYLWHQNTWEISASNIAKQTGDLSNLNVFGKNMTGYSEYSDSVYFTGTITQVKEDGTPVMTANDRGAWKNGMEYDYYDRVSHDGRIWLCINEQGTTTMPGDNNPDWLLEIDKGRDGKDGTSFTIIGSVTDESELPASADVGDAYLIDGNLWVWTKEGQWKNAGNIQGPAGQSVQPIGDWYNGLNVPYLGVVQMGTGTFMCNNKAGTTNPPMWVWTDKDGNLFTYNDGNYVLTGDYNTVDYIKISDTVKIQRVDIEYVLSKSNSEAPITGWQTTAPKWQNGMYLWSRQVTYYTDGTKDVSDSVCISGGKGIASIVEYYYRSSSATELVGGEWSTTCPEWINGTYIWTKSVITYTDGSTDESAGMNNTGAQGEGYTQMGEWYDGMLCPKLGVVTMAGSSFAAKVATRNPPMWVWTDKDGNLFTYNDGKYVLTGEYNTEEYDVLAHKGDTGDKGNTGDKGETGKDGRDYEWIYKRLTYYTTNLETPESEQIDNYVPDGWTGNSMGISSTYPYEYMCKRSKNNGTWSAFSKPVVWAKYGEDGRYTKMIFKWSDSKPEKPSSVLSPSGWSTDPSGSNVTGEFIASGGWYRSPTATSNSTTYKARYSFITKSANEVIQIEVSVSSESNYDFGYVSKLDTIHSTSNYTYRGSGVETQVLNITVPSAGSHFIEFAYVKDSSQSSNDDLFKFRVLSGGSSARNLWYCTGLVIPPSTSVEWSDPQIWGGLQGCVIRSSEWALGTEYRNDSDVVNGSLEVRYIDVAFVRNTATATGWDAYQCLKTHTSSSSITYTNTAYWEKFSQNVTAVLASLIIAKNAKIMFLQGNQLLIQTDSGVITAGLSGSMDGNKIRIWAGSSTPDNAPFRVNADGKVWAEDAVINGDITARSLTLGLSTATGSTPINGALIGYPALGQSMVLPELQDGETRIIEYFYPLMSRTTLTVTFTTENSNVKIAENGDVLRAVNSLVTDGYGYIRFIGFRKTTSTTYWCMYRLNITT